MRQSGCRRLWLAPESGSPRIVRDVIHKKFDSAKVFEVSALAVGLGLPVTCFFVIGFPQETRQDILLTLDMALALRQQGVDQFWFSCAVPYLGTELHALATTGLGMAGTDLAGAANRFSTHEATLDTMDFDAAEIRSIREAAMRVLHDPASAAASAQDILDEALAAGPTQH
jgi:hypothetical protein